MTPATQECHPSGSYVAIFSSIHYVLKAEQLLKQGWMWRRCSGCGMAITFAPSQLAEVQSILGAADIDIARIFCKEAEGSYREIKWNKQ